jgi:hypothetical protein
MNDYLIWYIGCLIGYLFVGITLTVKIPYGDDLPLFPKIWLTVCWLPLLLWVLFKEAVNRIF